MADSAASDRSDSRSAKLRRFVAYSILAHLGGGISWGVPAWLNRIAEQDRIQEEKQLAEHFRKEEVKTKEHVRTQHIEQTRKEVETELRKEFDKLTAALSQPKRDELWKSVAEKTTPESTHFAEALGNPDTPEQDLRTLEAELRRAMIDSLNDELNAATARELADRFVDQVESQVAPDLANWMSEELKNRVAQKMREEGEALIATQRREAEKAKEQTLGALREAAAKTDAANAAAQQAGEQLAQAQATAKQADAQLAKGDDVSKKEGDKTKAEAGKQNTAAGKQVEQANARLGEADAKVDQATAKAAGLDGKARQQVAAADAAITTARDAVSKAATAVQTKSDDANVAVANAQKATAAAQQATKTAIDAVANGEDRGIAASAAIRAAAEATLSKDVEQALTDDLTKTTLPRLAGKLQDAFKKQLDQNGMSDDALVAAVGREVQERLAKSVPALAKAGDQAVDGKMGDVGPAAAGAVAPTLGDSILDKALAEGLAGMGANAAKRVGELAGNASQDGRLVGKAMNGIGAGAGEGDAAAMAELRDSVGAMARSMSGGRLGSGSGSGSGFGMGGLRASALGRSGGASSMRNEKVYQEITAQIAGRQAVQGEHWARQGAQGETSQAEAKGGDVAARVVGEAAAEAKSAISNDQPYAPTFKSIVFATVPYFNGQFRIDGNLAKWDALPAIALKPEYGSDPSVQVMKLAWSNAGLFFYCKIADANHQIDKTEVGNFWQGDVVEVWVDAYNTKEKYRARHIGQQFWVWPDGSKSDPTLMGGESATTVKGGGYKPTGLRADQLERWATQTPEGWVMEVRLPPALIADADLAAGRILGFNTYIGTSIGNGGGGLTGATGWYWSAGKQAATYGQPDTWGDLLLAGSDAKIEVLSGHEDAAKHVVTVGEPLRLRVTDGDMDLDPTVRDKVMVTLKDAHGGQQIAVLEETGPSTGTFDGAVSTALALDEPVPAVLSVYEGERIEIVYTDQARANGAREAQLSTSVSFGAAVMAMSASTKTPAP